MNNRQIRRRVKAMKRAQAFALLRPYTRQYLMRSEPGWFETFAGDWMWILGQQNRKGDRAHGS